MNTLIRSVVRQSLMSTKTNTQLLMRSLCAAQQKYDKDAIEKLLKNNKVVVFMKGNPDSPRCGFSNAVCQIMRMHGVNYDSHDVLQSEMLRQSIKDFTNWPTIPQVFINGEFVGGCDILLQMHQSGDLIEELKKVGIESLMTTSKMMGIKLDDEKGK